MEIIVTGKSMDVGDALRTHVTDMIGAMAEKYFERAQNASVVFTMENGRVTTDCHIHLPTGLFMTATNTAHEPYPAFDQALEKLDKQLRRYKRRLRSHHGARREKVTSFSANYHVIDSNSDEASEPEGFDPLIVADMEMQVQEFTVGEAVMQLELSHKPAMMFRNAGHGGLNMIYRRDDGHIGWVDPSNGSNS